MRRDSARGRASKDKSVVNRSMDVLHLNRKTCFSNMDMMYLTDIVSAKQFIVTTEEGCNVVGEQVGMQGARKKPRGMTWCA
jgi:hypothetical protein